MLKRIFDVFVSSLLLLILLPLLPIIAIFLKLHFGSVFFRQWRPGLHEAPFQLMKFQTMHNMSDSNGVMLSDEKRLTNFGRFLRATSLDELPELWNVIKGEMSLVGPRPLLMDYLPLYNDEQKKRHHVLPGITGWAQVNGRNALSWDDKFKLDVWYVENHSFWLDLKILLVTLKRVFERSGITAQDHATVSPFQGNHEA